jgi:hypothetical protein
LVLAGTSGEPDRKPISEIAGVVEIQGEEHQGLLDARGFSAILDQFKLNKDRTFLEQLHQRANQSQICSIQEAA